MQFEIDAAQSREMKGRAPEMKGLWKAQDEDQGWWWHHDQGSEGGQVSSVAATDALAGKRAARRPQCAERSDHRSVVLSFPGQRTADRYLRI